MIVNSVMFFNELDLLELRLGELWDVVDRFIIVESSITHSGNPKPLYFTGNLDRFAKYAKKTVAINVGDMPTEILMDIYHGDKGFQTVAWTREGFQRNAGLRGMLDLDDTDTVIISDGDEIPSTSCVRNNIPDGLVLGLQMLQHEIFLNRRGHDPMVSWGMASYKTVKAIGPNRIKNCHLDNNDVQRQIISNAGWHFSWMGGYSGASQKVQAFAHEELPARFNEVLWNKMMSEGTDVWGRPSYSYVQIDESFPAYLRANPDRFSHLVRP